jgi:glycerol-3-phosphate dehydrogenase (NAD(P)+)
MRVAILGAGAWGTALAVGVAGRHEVTLWARERAQVATMQVQRENQRYLPGVPLPAHVSIVSELDCVAGADLVVIATPMSGLRSTAAMVREFKPANVVWLCKGLEADTGELADAVVAQTLPGVPGAVLSGPSFAEEVARALPTALTVASVHAALCDTVVEALHTGPLRVYSSTDVVGVEVGGAVKNIMAIATGICDGLSLGANARAALITRGLAEMMRFAVAMGGRPETVMGLTGAGDLILTCTGALSRNRRVGLMLGAGEPLEAVLASIGHVAEGVHCARAVLALAHQRNVDMPITDVVCSVMFEGLAARSAVSMLLARAPKVED